MNKTDEIGQNDSVVYRLSWRTLYEDCCEVRTQMKCHCAM